MTRPAEPEDLGATTAVCKPFAAVPSNATSAMHAKMTARRFKAGDLILKQGEPGTGMFMLHSGQARAEVRGADGTVRVVGRFGPADLVGEMALLTRASRSADVIAETAVRAGYLGAEDFDELALRHPALGQVLTEVVAERLGGAAQDGMSGKELGGCTIVRCVGRGAMGVVYEANDPASVGRVALKMMSHRLIFQKDALSRFRREANVAMSVDHPHIARVHRRFSAFRTNFIVMEFLDGPTVADLAARRANCDPASVRALVGQLASALQHLHTRSLIHRDLKPGNVIVTPQGRAVLADFGLAKSSGKGVDGIITQTRAVVGTPLYLPPQQCLGDPAGPDADVYALGTVALELLLGRVPFSGRSISEAYEAKLAYVVPPADAIAGGIPADLHDFLRRAVAARPEERRAIDLSAVAAWAAPLPV